LVFPVAFLDTAFYWWIFVSLLRTISQLQVRKQTIKLEMYRRFLITLVVSGVISALVIFSQLMVQMTKEPDDTWQTDWIWAAFWHILYFAILLAIAIIWRPTDNNTRYAYTELLVDNPEEEIHLQPLNLVTQRSKKEDETSIVGNSTAGSSNGNSQGSQKDVKIDENKDAKILEIPVSFSIDDADEENGLLERSKLE